MKKGIVVIIILILIAFIAYFTSIPNQNKIGAILPLSGENAEWGVNAKNGIDLAIEKYNENFNENIEILYQDTKGEPKGAVNATNFLINNNVQVIIGDMSSATTLAAAAICEKNNVLLISPVSSSPKITDAGDFIYRIWPSDSFEAKFTTKWLIKSKFKKIALIFQNDDFGIILKETFKSDFVSKGGSVLFEESFPTESKNFKDILNKIKNLDFDAIYLIAHYKSAAAFLRQKIEYNITGNVFGVANWFTMDWLTVAGNSGEGIFVPNRESINFESEQPNVKMFRKFFEEKYAKKPGLVEYLSYDVTNLILESFKNNSRSSEDVKKYFDNLTMENPYNGITGSIYFDSKGDLAYAAFNMLTVKNGEFVNAN